MSDWSSDVCSSDLEHRCHRPGAAQEARRGARPEAPQRLRAGAGGGDRTPDLAAALRVLGAPRSRAWPRASPERTGLSMAGQALGFHQLHRGAKNSWWRSLLGVVLLLLIGLVILPLFLEVAILVGILASGTDDVLADYQRLLDLTNPTPLGLAHLNLVLAGLIPTVFFISWALHGLKPGWRTSIMPRMRWSFFAVCLGLSFIALFATL